MLRAWAAAFLGERGLWRGSEMTRVKGSDVGVVLARTPAADAGAAAAAPAAPSAAGPYDRRDRFPSHGLKGEGPLLGWLMACGSPGMRAPGWLGGI